MTKSKIEELLALHIKAEKLPEPEREYKFHSKRRWRFDFAWPEKMIAVEVEGGIWTNGRHTRGKGFENDCIKYGEAACLGWILYRCTGNMIQKGDAIKTIKRLLKGD